MPAATNALSAQSEEPIPALEVVADTPSEDEEEEVEAGAEGAAAGATGAAKKKKNKKKKSKAKKAAEAAEGGGAKLAANPDGSLPLDLSGKTRTTVIRGLNADLRCDSYAEKYGQTFPPTKPIADLFENTDGPLGEICEYVGDSNRHRITSEELRAEERLQSDWLRNCRIAAECHRQTRKWAQSWIKPGIRLIDMCEEIEDRNRLLIRENGLKCGPGFPTGCSLNHIAAHYSPNVGDNTILGYDDVMKVDFGVQVEGRIIDCAFTVAFNPVYDPLLATVKAATNEGIKLAGIDARLSEIGAAIQEVMEAGEVTIGDKTFPIKCCRNLQGHSINPYQIHGAKSVPIVKGSKDSLRMEEGEVYAIETFGSTGRGFVVEDLECSHYMKNPTAPRVQLRTTSSQKLLGHITKTFGTLAFCRRWLERPDGGSFTVNKTNGKQEKYMGSLKLLVDAGLVTAYPPLCDSPGSYVAQYEHTLVLRPTCKEVLSRGDDY